MTEPRQCTATITNEYSGGEHRCSLKADHSGGEAFGGDHAGETNDQGVRYCWSDHADGSVPHEEEATPTAESVNPAAVLSVASAYDQLRSMALSLATCKGEIVDPRSFNAAIDAYGNAIRAEQTGVAVPREILDGLIHVAAWVSRGRSAAFIPDEMLGNVYPDATARRALGAVDELGLRRRAAAAQADVRCPRCGEALSEYADDDLVYRVGDERPYCSGECVVAAHRNVKAGEA